MKPLYEIIDVSEHNTRRAKIDWEKVKASGVKGVMVRSGWAGYDGRIAGNNGLDDAFEQNIRLGCLKSLNKEVRDDIRAACAVLQ